MKLEPTGLNHRSGGDSEKEGSRLVPPVGQGAGDRAGAAVRVWILEGGMLSLRYPLDVQVEMSDNKHKSETWEKSGLEI